MAVEKIEKYQKDYSKRIFSNTERQAPIDLKETEPTHSARYEFALKFILPEDKILDAPCGSGYGTYLMSSAALEAKGVDIHRGAIEHAKEFFSSKNNSFLIGDVESLKEVLPEDECFDAIISFEGIEHLKHPQLFLKEAKRLLKKNGRLIISTPRKPHGSPYHFKEYSLEEFKELLSENFEIKQMFGQIYTNIFDLDEKPVNPDNYQKFNFIAYCTPKEEIDWD